MLEQRTLFDVELYEDVMSFVGEERILEMFNNFHAAVSKNFEALDTGDLSKEETYKRVHLMASMGGSIGSIRFSDECRILMDKIFSCSDQEIKDDLSAIKKVYTEFNEVFQEHTDGVSKAS